jgi:hypothetical protein
MLPGFRFLFAAVILSMSVLIFGLGAAALLRTAHEEFASLPTRRAPPEPVFPRPNDSLIPTLAMLRVDPPVAEKPEVPAAVVPEIVPDKPADAESAPETAPAAPEKLSALMPEELTGVEAVKLELPATEIVETPAIAAVKVQAPVADAEVKLAAITAVPEPSVATASPPAGPVSLEGIIAATRIATLGGPAVIVDERTAAETTEAKPDRSALRKQAAQRARERRRIAASRSRIARQAALAIQQQKAPNPFEQGLFPYPKQ